MTNFMTDPELNDGGTPEEPQSLSLLGGVVDSDALPEAGDDDFGPAKSNKASAIGGTMLLIALVLVLGAGGIYAMSLRNKGIVASVTSPETESKMRDFLARITADQMAGASTSAEIKAATEIPPDILDVFTTDPTKQQVPIDYVKKNPFERVQKIATTDGIKPDPNAGDREAARRLRDLQNELSSLDLQSVIGGRRPVAMINGELVQKNQRVGAFIVQDIRDTMVFLTADGQTFELKMDDPATDNPNVRRR